MDTILNQQVTGASLKDADLSDTRLRSVTGYVTANWIGADLRSVDFTGQGPLDLIEDDKPFFPGLE